MTNTRDMMNTQPEALKITVSARALHQVLGALVGPGHYIRELQVTRNLPGVENPINTLIEEYNGGIEAARAAIAKHGGAA